MPFQTSGGIRYFTFESLDRLGVRHGVFTRQGGVSLGHWQSLNVGGTVGDQALHVEENRRRTFRTLERDLNSLFDVWQVHSDKVVCAPGPRPKHQAHQRADAILTDRAEVTLFMRFADCVPILLYDPRRKVAGLAHAGWQGTVLRTAAAAVREMQACYGSQPGTLVGAIGPSIGPDHYEIGPDVIRQVHETFGSAADSFLILQNGRIHLDLWEANRWVLEQSGVEQVELAGICTACHVDEWYSHRAEKGRTGRFGALIALG